MSVLTRSHKQTRKRPLSSRRSRPMAWFVGGMTALALLGMVLGGLVLAADSGFLNPTAQAAVTGGDNDGFEANPTNAFTNEAGAASNINGAGDRHTYFNYGISVPADAFVQGIEVRLDWWLDSDVGINSLGVELSWDGGATWTAAKTDSAEPTLVEHTATLGGSTDRWGHRWTPAELNNANFRVRLTANSTNGSRDFFLDWVAVKVSYSLVEPNPPMAGSCGTDMVLVIDGSGSIDAAEYAQMQAALTGFVQAFEGTPTQYAFVEFATSALVRQGFTGDDATLITEINKPRVQPGGQFTNWDDGLFEARALFPHRSNPDLILFASDGNPNRRDGHSGHPGDDGVDEVNESAAMEWAIEEANAAKLAGTRIVALGIGGGAGESETLDVQNLIAIAGANVADAPGEINAETDVILADFDTLADVLSDLALEICGGTITVHKIIDGDGDLGTTADQSDGAGWTFAAGAAPDSASPSSGATDANGLINFDIDLGEDRTATVNILETVEPGYVFLSASCFKPDGDDPDEEPDPVGTPATNAVNAITLGPLDIVTCTFFNAGTVDLYIFDVTGAEDSAGDELVFNATAENLLPGETITWVAHLRNDGPLPWDLTSVDTSGSSGWSCDGDPDPEFAVAFFYTDSFADNHGGTIHAESTEYEEVAIHVTLDSGAGNECQSATFSLSAVFNVTQHLP